MTTLLRQRSCAWTLVGGLILGLGAAPVRAEVRALPEGKLPADKRLQLLKDLDGYFPFAVPASKAEWEPRAERVRRQILVSQGLWPLPTKTPLKPVIHGKVEKDDYTVEKVYFESMPGFFVTGSLFRPKNRPGKSPGVLCPHGHWASGRFHDAGADRTKQEIAQGAEKFEDGGRSPLQARCVHLARMGCVVFHYDMLGYADSTQLSFDLVHRFAKQRPEMTAAENWGLFSPQAESHLQSAMGLQTWNSIRALDFLETLADVDAKRIAVTGASGGGTQTFLLAAVDPRVTVAFPAVMVSTAMQGGCTCENASLLRVGTGNIEFAGLFAPKPQGLTAANDWTKEMATKGFPELQQLYELYGVRDRVMLANYTQFGHNYNLPSRQAMYVWVNQHFGLGLEKPADERDYARMTAEQLTVWNAEHPRPAGGPDFERQLVKWWHDDAQKQLSQLAPTNPGSLTTWREVVGRGTDIVIGRGLPAAADVEYEQTGKEKFDRYIRMVGVIRNKPQGEELPALFLYPKPWDGRVVIWLDAAGKGALLAADGSPQPAVQKLLDAGVSVTGVDLLFQGEFLASGEPVTSTRRVKNPRESAAYTFGYNPALFAQRVHDVMTTIAFVRGHDKQPKEVDLVGFGAAGAWAAAARAQAGGAVNKCAVDTAAFRFHGVTDLHDPRFLPGGAKYGDLPGFLALSAPDKLWIAGEGKQVPGLVAAAFDAAGATSQVTSFAGEAEQTVDAALAWLLAK